MQRSRGQKIINGVDALPGEIGWQVRFDAIFEKSNTETDFTMGVPSGTKSEANYAHNGANVQEFGSVLLLNFFWPDGSSGIKEKKLSWILPENIL